MSELLVSFMSAEDKNRSSGLQDISSADNGVRELIARGALETYEEFKAAYRYIELERFDSAKRRFEKLLSENGELLARIRRVTDESCRLLLDRDTLYAIILAAETVEKSLHNLWVLAKERGDGEEADRLYDENAYAKAELSFYRKIRCVFAVGGMTDAEDEYKIVPGFYKPLSELYFFAFCINGGGATLDRYLSAAFGNERMHFYNVYGELVRHGVPRVAEKLDTVGEYLCNTVDELPTKRILYHSIFYESAALEYAYKNGRRDIAEKIVRNGYDCYLELDTLSIIYKYDREKFYREIGSLKKLCLERGIALTGENYFYEHRYIRNLYGDEFCDEFVKAAQIELKALESADEGSPRLRKDRNTPDWAK